jgi:mono/diheme cytochrome c family protein
VAGCAAEPPAERQFAVRDEVSQLDVAKHQEQIRGFLWEYFGSPAEPRLKVPGGNGDAGGEGSAIVLVDKIDPLQLRHGRDVYQRRCAGCHGISGDGNGPAAEFLNPRPRDYRQGKYKFTSTPRGAKPRRQDLVRTIRRGAKGTSMPAFRWMSDEDLRAVIDYVIMLSHRGEMELQLIREARDELFEEDDFDSQIVAQFATVISRSWDEAPARVVMPVTPPVPFDEPSVLKGKVAFLTKGCAKCHGTDGRGYTQENVGKDDWGNVVKAADLSSGMLHGGRRPVDVYRRIYLGINGTPMPAFNLALQDEPETVWHLVHFVLSLVEGREVPEVELPTTAGGAAAAAAEAAPQADGE